MAQRFQRRNREVTGARLGAVASLYVPPMHRLLAFLCVPALAAAAPLTDHVFIFSFDGGKPAVIQESEMPNLKRLAAEGAVTWEARTIVPSITLPSHTSMLTGVDIAKHQITWNNFEPLRGIVKQPTIFSLAKAAHPGITTALFAGKIKFRHLWIKDSLDVFNCGGAQDGSPLPASDEKKLVKAAGVAAQAAPYIRERKPALCFIHFPDPDSAGHAFGWGTVEQKAAFKAADEAFGVVLAAIKEAGIEENSTLIITADHGGKDKAHFADIPENRTISWITWGKGVRKGRKITDPVRTYDTAATALWLLDVAIPDYFDGKPVKEAYETSPVAALLK